VRPNRDLLGGRDRELDLLAGLLDSAWTGEAGAVFVTHLRNIMRKLGVSSRVEVARMVERPAGATS
jgi:hypothetical protein